MATEIVDFYSDYFGQPYPLPKLDLVSLHKMNVRAMENWGCITFTRNVLLTNSSDFSGALYQRNARTVAHEISHMWFGNLVTMNWWDDIWLNEGFARFAEHHILHELRPQFSCWDKYLWDVRRTAIYVDRVAIHTHPV